MNMFKKQQILSLFLVFALSFSTWAKTSEPPEEGMWLPLLLNELNYKDMKAKGLKLKPKEIYSINQASLKDAIVSFGGFCTGEVISNEGLLLTNHHCGYGQIQQHSSVENDYLTDGFWAMTRDQELPNEGLTATFIVKIEDVTTQALVGVSASMSEKDREAKIKKNIATISKKASEGTHYEAVIKPFFYGNEYYMFVTETFKDVRLVGAPLSAIGKFGGDTDNWMWPRHTGDFSMFRIYAGPDNKPAEYSPNNKPYKPKHFLPISLKGVKKDDFTMVMGFPGRTQEYLSSYGVNNVMNESNPYKIALRGKRLDIMNKYMKQSDKVRIQYASKQSRISNYWKKWIGENRGLKKLNAIERKKKLEKEFREWVNAKSDRKQKYGEIIPNFEKAYKTLSKVSLARDYVNEAVLGSELLNMAYIMYQFAGDFSEKTREKTEKRLDNFFKDFYLPLEKENFVVCMQAYYEDIPKDLHPAMFAEINGDFEAFANNIFSKSMLLKETKVRDFVKNVKSSEIDKIGEDKAYQLFEQLLRIYFSKVSSVAREAQDAIDLNQRTYVAALREMKTDTKFYPDANSTLRFSYGKVDDYFPYDGAHYNFFTTLDGIMEKYATGEDDYLIPEKMKTLYQNKDYGQYAMSNGKLPVCFTASNHTTGGNSGSPIMNAEGQLIGLNFDRNWEGTMSDIMYDPDRVRNISVDIRYVLFVVDKLAGAGHLVKEMELIK